MEKISAIEDYLKGSGWLRGPFSVTFLAAGEYNENFLVRTLGGGAYVFRVNHGSQLGIADQISYEYAVLRAVGASGVTPNVHFADPRPAGIGGGALLMDYIEGRPLDYAADFRIAARIFARIHALPVPSDAGLVVQMNPVLDIARESLGLIERFPDHPLQVERTRLLAYHDEVLKLGEETRGLFADEPPCIVNTEVNSHNFIIHGDTGHLVDWEKAVVSYRYQDLGHFLVPTTTRWRADYGYSRAEKRAFLGEYAAALGTDIPPDELERRTRVLERTILLRGLSWCFMAYYEYTRTERALKNEYTFNKIREYMRDLEWFLASA